MRPDLEPSQHRWKDALRRLVRRCYSVSGLVEEMQNVTGLSSVREAFAWERSLLTLPTLLGPIAGL